MPRSRVAEAVSAGGVVYRYRDDALEIVLCGRVRQQTWSLPKGTPDGAETLEETALREVREETGLEVKIEAPLESIEYWFTQPPKGVRYHKCVHFYLMATHGGAMEDHDPEFDEVRWFSSQDALKSMTFANEAKVVARAVEALSERSGAHG